MPKKAILLVKIEPHYDFSAIKKALLAADIQADEFHLYDDTIARYVAAMSRLVNAISPNLSIEKQHDIKHSPYFI
jgi:hypothetical protein